MAAFAGTTARQQHRGRLALHVPADWTHDSLIEAIADGATFANSTMVITRIAPRTLFSLRTVHIGGTGMSRVAEALERGRGSVRR